MEAASAATSSPNTSHGSSMMKRAEVVSSCVMTAVSHALAQKPSRRVVPAVAWMELKSKTRMKASERLLVLQLHLLITSWFEVFALRGVMPDLKTWAQRTLSQAYIDYRERGLGLEPVEGGNKTAGDLMQGCEEGCTACLLVDEFYPTKLIPDMLDMHLFHSLVKNQGGVGERGSYLTGVKGRFATEVALRVVWKLQTRVIAPWHLEISVGRWWISLFSEIGLQMPETQTFIDPVNVVDFLPKQLTEEIARAFRQPIHLVAHWMAIELNISRLVSLRNQARTRTLTADEVTLLVELEDNHHHLQGLHGDYPALARVYASCHQDFVRRPKAELLRRIRGLYENTTEKQTVESTSDPDIIPPIGRMMIKRAKKKPFQALMKGTWLSGRPNMDAYRLIISAFRLRYRDEYQYDLANYLAGYSVMPDRRMSCDGPLRDFVHIVDTRGFLPKEWEPCDIECLLRYACDRNDWRDPSEDTDLSLYALNDDKYMVAQLRIFADAVLGGSVRGQSWYRDALPILANIEKGRANAAAILLWETRNLPTLPAGHESATQAADTQSAAIESAVTQDAATQSAALEQATSQVADAAESKAKADDKGKGNQKAGTEPDNADGEEDDEEGSDDGESDAAGDKPSTTKGAKAEESKGKSKKGKGKGKKSKGKGKGKK